MLDHLTPSPEPQAARDLAPFVCREDDTLWVGIERALDNGCGLVFVVDRAGVLVGRAGLAELRTAVSSGAHLAAERMGASSVACDPQDRTGVLTPVLDAANR